MAWRDSRRNRGKLLLFISSIVVGIAALVAINSFSINLQKDINNESKSLLAADLLVDGNQPPSDSLQQRFDELGAMDQAHAKNFLSFVYFPRSGQSRMAQVKALEGNYPFYGTLTTQPADAAQNFRNKKQALVENGVMIQYDLEVGDTVRIGNAFFEIAGQIDGAPGRSALAGSFAPLILIPMDYLEDTKLMQFGSRVEYQYYFKFDDETDVETLAETQLDPVIDTLAYRYDTVEERKEDFSEVFGILGNFLNLVGFIALLLGCIGVASSVHIYIKDKLSAVAVLRCLGASGQQAFLIFLIQIAGMGLIGALIGAAIGSLLQMVLPLILQDFLPLQNVSKDVSFYAIGQGVLTGLGIAILFALLPLLSIRKISPLRSLRASFNKDVSGTDPLAILVYVLILLFIIGFTMAQVGFNLQALFFPIAIAVGFLALTGMALLLMWFVRKFFPRKWSYVWRQSIANLYRPNNQTLILMVAIGLGTALISTMFFSREMLLQQVELSSGADRPNMLLFDIQSSQLEGVNDLAEKHELAVLEEVPIVTMRIQGLEDSSRTQFLQDTSSDVSRGSLLREYRATYRNELSETEEIVEGFWHGDKPESDTVFVSLEKGLAERLEVGIGSPITFDVQGIPIETVVSSTREVDFTQFQTNFFVVFEEGVLEDAPKFHVMLMRSDSVQQSGLFQRELTADYANISMIDLNQILKTVDNVLSKVSFVVRFMAFFSILTGIIVLISSIVLSKYQRVQESVLLRTIGASRRQILWINALEYFMLGTLAALTGILLSVLGSFLLAKFGFQVPFAPNWWVPIFVFLGIGVLTVILGLMNSREILVKPPLEVLRKEV